MNALQSGLILLLSSVLCIAEGCKDDKGNGQPEARVIVYKKEKDSILSKNAPIINISDTVSLPCTIIYVKDSALNSQRLAAKLANIYNNQLTALIKQNKLTQTGPKMAWYRSAGAPFFFEAGIPVNKKPSKLSKKARVKSIAVDSILVAHFYGPYELTFHAYDALKEWMKERSIKPSGPAYEIYIGESFDKEGKLIDPYKVRTDIVIPH